MKVKEGLTVGIALLIALSACSERTLDTQTPGLEDFRSIAGFTGSQDIPFQNGNFEKWQDNGMPKVWIAGFVDYNYETSRNDLILSSSTFFSTILKSFDAKDYLRSIQLAWGTKTSDYTEYSVLYQCVTVPAGSNYIFSFYTKTVTGSPKVQALINIYTSKYELIAQKKTTALVPATNWTLISLTNQAPWTARYANLCIYVSSSAIGTILVDEAYFTISGGGAKPAGTDPTTFKGPYTKITNVNYPASFKGTTGIADLKALIPTTGQTITGSWAIKGVITGLTVYLDAPSKRVFYVQDTTGGMYCYANADAAIDANSVGKVVEMTVTELKNYSGVREISKVSGAPTVTTNGAPDAIYAKDLTWADPAQEGNVVRYTGKVTVSGSTIEIGTLPAIYGLNDLGIIVGDTVTVVGPMTVHTDAYQVDSLHAYPNSDATYVIVH